VVFTPRADRYAFAGSWTLGKLVSGVVDLPQRMASPSTLSWNHIADWFQQVEDPERSGLLASERP